MRAVDLGHMRHQLELFADERVLVKSDNGCVLTTHRVRHEARTDQGHKWTSIMLEQVSACSVESSSQPLLFAFAIVAVLLAAGIFIGEIKAEGVGIFLVLLSVVLFSRYLMTRKVLLVIMAPGDAKIAIEIREKDPEPVSAFVDTLEQAKNERVLLLSGQSAGRSIAEVHQVLQRTIEPPRFHTV